MTDYSKAKIYKIYSDEVNSQVYYGSTIRELQARTTAHRCDYRSYLKGDSGYCYCYVLFDKYGLKKCKIELIENYPCNDKSALLKREGEFIRRNECVNKNIAGRTREQYRQDTNEQRRQRSKIYYRDNREKCLERGKKWRENNPEYNKKYRQDTKERDRQRKKIYYQNNREKERERCKKWRENNPEYGKKWRENNPEYYKKKQLNITDT